MKLLITSLMALLFMASTGQSQTIEDLSLTNPVMSFENKSVKDYAVVEDNGTWYVFMSSFYRSRGRIRSHVVGVTTRDFKTYSSPFLIEDGRSGGWIGMASPDIKRIDGQWVMTLNSWGDKRGQKNQLFYKTSRDLINWSPLKPLAKNITRGERTIDAAIIKYNGWVYLAWKEDQRPQIARGRTLSGNYEFIGDLRFTMANGSRVERFENYQFFVENDQVKLLATAQRNAHLPTVFSLSGSSTSARSWQSWDRGYTINLPRQGFNTEDRANAAVLSLGRDAAGLYTLYYAGSNRETRDEFSGRGWNHMGIARSSDLVNWTSLNSAAAPSQFVRCSSDSRRYNECPTRLSGAVSVILASNVSSADCVRGQTWGVSGNRIWVDDGCRGIFSVVSAN